MADVKRNRFLTKTFSSCTVRLAWSMARVSRTVGALRQGFPARPRGRRRAINRAIGRLAAQLFA